MDYYGIGQRIRKYRKANKMSQEELAEAVGISVTHMSHIETGNTKVSLAVFSEIAQVLRTRADDLLFEKSATKGALLEELSIELEECSSEQVQAMVDIIKATKDAFEKYL